MTHYSLAQNTKMLKVWAARMSLSVLDRGIYQPVLVYSGMSGIAAATALSIALDNIGVQFGMIYVRKENEKSHGHVTEYEIPEGFDSCTYIFVDDFICEGDTRNWCESKLDGEKFSYHSLQKKYGCDVKELIEC